MCVKSWVLSNNRHYVKLVDMSGFGYGSTSPSRASFIIYDANWNKVGSLIVDEGTGQTDFASGVDVFVEDVFPGAFNQEAWARVRINSVSQPTATAVQIPQYCPDGSMGKIIQRGPTNDRSWTNIGLDTSSHPEIARYRIQWYNGGWSPWYTPGEGDVDWKITTRRVWA